METRHVATVRSGYYTHTVELITWKQYAHEILQPLRDRAPQITRTSRLVVA